jgi:hypothetical protein
MLMDDDLKHGLIADPALAGLSFEFVDDRRIEQY